jgi:hypothetical protein
MTDDNLSENGSFLLLHIDFRRNDVKRWFKFALRLVSFFTTDVSAQFPTIEMSLKVKSVTKTIWYLSFSQHSSLNTMDFLQ